MHIDDEYTVYEPNNVLQSKLTKAEDELNEKMQKIAEIMGVKSILDLPFCVYLSVIYTYLGLKLPSHLATKKTKYVTYEDDVARIFGKSGD